MRQVMQAAEASAELARRMEQVGQLQQAAAVRASSASMPTPRSTWRAREQAQRATRERLTRLLGLWGAQTRFTLPERLPDLPARRGDLPDIERIAHGAAAGRAGRRLAAEQTAQQPGPDAQHALHQRAGTRARAQQLERGADRSAAGRSASSCRCSTGATRAWPAPRASTCRPCTAPPRPPSTRAPKCARPMAPTARPTTSRATTATRSCRCASASPKRTCCATTAC